MAAHETQRGAGVRASDGEREAAAVSLRTHCAAGRLSVEELEQRTAAALAARTIGDLDALFEDLPGGRLGSSPAAPVRDEPASSGGFGLMNFHQRHEIDLPRRAAFREFAGVIVPTMSRSGYDVVNRSEPELLILERVERPAWVPIVCILFFPLGLLALLASTSERVVVTFDEIGPERTAMSVHGRARRPTRRVFEDLSLP